MLTEMENGLIVLIRESALGKCLTGVRSLPDIDGDNLVKRFGSEAPAVYVTPTQIKVRPGEWLISFGLGCVARSGRSQAAARKGDGHAIGLYQIVEGVVALADRARTGDINWSVIGVEYISDTTLANNALHVATVMLQTSGWVELPALLDESGLAPFERLRADYDIEPHDPRTEHNKWAGDPQDLTDSAPEVTDHINLPQE
jgi:hypothetical protein